MEKQNWLELFLQNGAKYDDGPTEDISHARTMIHYA